MHDQPDQQGEDRRPEHAPDSPTTAQRKPYRAPRLVVYGDLRRITMAKGGSANDGGGNPKTKV